MKNEKDIIEEIKETRDPLDERKGLKQKSESYIKRLTKYYPKWKKEYLKLARLVSWYDIITVIFPFLGILGTVLALLFVKTDFTEVNVNFLQALTSTFWGLIGAIGSKIGEGFISPNYEHVKDYFKIFTKDKFEQENMQTKVMA
jgi:biopolymer transport protein ExbB/TolQ